MATKTENQKNENKDASKTSPEIEDKPLEQCGIIMPISAIDGLPAEHWKEVLAIISDVIYAAGFEPNLVSNSSDVGIIQKRIVQNIYSNPIVVCDVSAKNPNVMFELGLRLAFDKPTIIIKDDATDYNFDTSPIEHLGYPRDLRFTTILDFKETLKNKIIATYKKSKEDPNFSTFLKHFGEYKISNLGEKEITTENYLLQSIEELKDQMRFVRNHFAHSAFTNKTVASKSFTIPEVSKSIIKAKPIILKVADEFISHAGFENYYQVVQNRKLDDLIDHLWNHYNVRPFFTSRDVLKSYVVDYVFDPPF